MVCQLVEIAFCVKGHPPKKISDKSMWSTDNQVPLLIELRKQALKARDQVGINTPLKTKLSLELKIFGSEQELYEIGDLDNLLSGVCDALQPKPNNPTLEVSELFNSPEFEEISPDKAILFDNDSNIYKIHAEKRITSLEKYYSVTLKPIETKNQGVSHRSDSFKENILYWAEKYDEDHPWWTDEEQRIGEMIRKNNEFGLNTLKEIVHWKFYTLPGRQKRVNNLLAKYSDKQIREITRKTFNKKTDQARIETLRTIKGIGVALASTILTMYDPFQYCIYDIHVMREVYGQEPKYMFTSSKYYLQLLKELRKLSNNYNIQVRTIEKAFFKKNLS